MKRHRHSLSHHRLSSFNMGELYPIGCVEVLPGDTFHHQTAVLLRVTPLIAPVMHPVDIQVHHWFVPSRLVWVNFESFITNDQTSLTTPQIVLDGSTTAGCRRLASAMGIGIGADTTTVIGVSALPFRAYNMIWNEFYRDQLVDAAVVEDNDNSDDDANYTMLRSRWPKDYYTTARPTAQSGTAAEAAVIFSETGATPGVRTLDRGAATADAAVRVNEVGTAAAPIVGAVTVEAIRIAQAQQRMREARNRFGSRYVDLLRFYGITPSDARMSRPEYLGGGKQTISFSEVLSTAATAEGDLGQLGGHGIAALRTRSYKRFFEEHGWVLSLVTVRPRNIYMQAVPRHFIKTAHTTYWAKEYDILSGDAPVYNQEIYYPSATPFTVFGYVPKFDEYRHHPSVVSGEFGTTLDTWHYGREFGAQPVLNSSFLECAPTDRTYVNTTVDELQAMIVHRLITRRLVSPRGRSERIPS